MNASTQEEQDKEQLARRSDFGLRLRNSMDKYGPLCVGIDPHRKLLTDWGYSVDADGAEMYSMRMLQAVNGRAAAVKFQLPMFERYGSKGFAALERVLYAARQMDVITIVDCLHGGLPTTISAIADAYFKPEAPLRADAITLLPYYGARSLQGLIDEALDNGRGVFIASLTSNEEGKSLQSAIRQTGDYAGKTVAYGIATTAQKHNADIDGMGSVGLIIGATIGQWINETGVDPARFTGPILSPGYGWQGAEAKDLRTVFKGTKGNVLVTVSRFIASHGPDISALSEATEAIALDVRQALLEATRIGDRHEEPEGEKSSSTVIDLGANAADTADKQGAQSVTDTSASSDTAETAAADTTGTATQSASAPASTSTVETDTQIDDAAVLHGSRLLVLTGPAGVGKGTVEVALRKKHPEVWVSVSATTRDPRPGEVNGVNYWFMSEEEFAAKEKAGEFLETALVHGLAHYGTPLKPLVDHLSVGTPTILEIDLQGARRVKQKAAELGLEVMTVFIAPPSFDELVRRLTGRGTETEEQRKRRLETAHVELAAENEFDVTIVNDNVQKAADDLWNVIAKEYGANA
ncbi:orotidine 5'-phosphate decarboxylase [Bifidobacterium callitrichos DSM 23973]|uniref:Guanylate kinase n=1 Tax=Bifidobacterium callitrichos DSM 23973 TaxID=1437609 RepID=A0A087ACG1_9BIFI|nr:orotidine 5'-phosphate decarboxylase [Bifidobacterium callitrichos DSM 23973]